LYFYLFNKDFKLNFGIQKASGLQTYLRSKTYPINKSPISLAPPSTGTVNRMARERVLELTKKRAIGANTLEAGIRHILEARDYINNPETLVRFLEDVITAHHLIKSQYSRRIDVKRAKEMIRQNPTDLETRKKAEEIINQKPCDITIKKAEAIIRKVLPDFVFNDPLHLALMENHDRTNSHEHVIDDLQEQLVQQKEQLDQQSQKIENLEIENTKDGLTGIYNVKGFNEIWPREFDIAKREGKEITFIVFDLDNFKRINDQYGHSMGDEVLKFVGETLSTEFQRPSDYVCRTGGDEFSGILQNTDEKGAVQVVQRVIEKLAKKKFNFEGEEFSITSSIGIYTIKPSQTDTTNDEVKEIADKAAYNAKQAKNTYSIARESSNGKIQFFRATELNNPVVLPTKRIQDLINASS
jgi:diguanylate cyclase (GGDEF)-like protein